MSDGETANLLFQRMTELFMKVPPLKKLEFQPPQKRTMRFVQKENFAPKIKPVIENLHQAGT